MDTRSISLEFDRFSLDPNKYNCMDITIYGVLVAHDEVGHLTLVSDGSTKDMHHMIFDQILATAKGGLLAMLFGGCDERRNLYMMKQ